MTTIDYQAPSRVALPMALNWRRWIKLLGPLVGLVFVFGIFSALRPQTFLDPFNLRIMLLQTAVVGTAALGMTIIIISGGIDLSVGSNIALCSVVIAWLINAGAPPILAALGGIGMGLLVGAVIGLLVSTMNLSPFIVTLGLMGVLRGTAKWVADNGVLYAPPQLHMQTRWIGRLLQLQTTHGWMVIPPGVWLMAVLALIVAALLRYTKFGRHVFAIGSNEQTARLCGVRIGRAKVLIYTVATGLVGIAAMLHYSKVSNQGDPTSALGLELDVIAAVVIGGASLNGGEGTVLGSLAGALMMTAVGNGCQKMDYPTFVQEIVTGAIIVVAAALDRLRQQRSA